MKAKRTYASAAFWVPENRADEAGGMLISDRLLGRAVADLVTDRMGSGDFVKQSTLDSSTSFGIAPYKGPYEK
jgi:hypothetical protein